MEAQPSAAQLTLNNSMLRVIINVNSDFLKIEVVAVPYFGRA